MMSRCLVRGCRSGSGGTDSSVTFHSFPVEQRAAERWARLCGVSDKECSQLLKDVEHGGAGKYHLCSLHFEEKAFETNPDDKTCNVILRQGAEPTLLLSPAKTDTTTAQVNTSLTAAHSSHRRTPPAASSCSSCTCAQPGTSESPTGPACGKSSRATVSSCPTGATVVSPQPGVSQIVLNFCEQDKGLTLDNVPAESSARCPGGCCPQRVVKQVVLIFLDHPRESRTAVASSSSQESPSTLSSSTQTEGKDGESKHNAHILSERAVHRPSSPRQEAVHTGTQTDETSTSMEVSGVQGLPEAMETTSSKIDKVPTSPEEQICTSRGLLASRSSEPDQQTVQTSQEPMQPEESSPQSDVTSRKDDVTHPLPISDKVQTTLESLDQESENGSCVAPSSAGDSQAQCTDDQASGHLRKCDPTPENPSQPPQCPHRQFCLDPSINQYVGDLLEQYNVPSPPCISASASSVQCSCITSQHRVKQIVVNFVEQERAVVREDVPAPCSATELSSPGVMSRQHQETQTCDDFPQQTPEKPKEKPKNLQTPPLRPPKSQSCPPVLIVGVALQINREEEGSPVHQAVSSSSLESKVTFEDIAVYFSKEEWELLGESAKILYREVMSDNYQALVSLGLLQEKPNLVLRIENEEENLWVIQESPRRIHHHEEGLGFLEQDMDRVRVLAKDNDASPCAGRDSVESSSHLGALMRLVNEIPGFLLGSSVTDGSCSPARSTEDHGSSRPFVEVKTEERSPACSPASAHVSLSETPEITASLGVHRITEQRNSKIVTKAEKAEIPVSQSSRYSTPVSHPPVSPSCIKSDPGSSHDSVPGRLQIKQEECTAPHLIGHQRAIPPMKPIITHMPKNPLYSPGSREHLIPDYARRPGSGGGTSLSRSTGASLRNQSFSPASASPGANCTGPGDLKIKIKQEDSGSEREMAESPVYGRKVYHSPVSSSMALHAEREHWRLAASPLRSPADVPLGSSPLHRLVNCLKEITASRPRPYSGTLPTTRWGPDMSRVCADSSVRVNREPSVPAPQPNPFTVAVTNGAAQLRGMEPKILDSQSMRASRDELHISNVPLSALGKCLEKIHPRVSSGQNIGASPNSEELRRAELGVKRTHSDDLSCRPGVYTGAKRPALEASSSSRVVSSCSPGHRDLWRPPEELPRAPSEDQPIGNSHLMSVMNCVRKIPGCRPSPSIQVTSTPDWGRTNAQGVVTEVKDIKVKQEKEDGPPLEASRQWIQPPQSPDVSKHSGPSATNVHLTGLMRLMEEIPCTDSSNSSRAMYSIAVGHSLARRLDRSNYLSCNDDSSFQVDLNDSTIASVDSVYSDDTSWSSENVDPSYSAIGGLQRVVSEFAELGSVSPLVAVAAPTSVQDGIGLKKPKEMSTASTPRLNESIRRSPRDAAGVAANTCSAENGEAAFAALRGLQKVVHGFVEQECVSPITAVRNNTPNIGPRDCPGRRTCQEEEAASPHFQGSSPASVSRFLCDTGKWPSEPDSSYSALSGLQKVVNGFSEMSCVSPFSAVSTPVSEGTAEVSMQRRSDTQDCASSTVSGQKNMINGVPDAGCLSPLTIASNVSSESDAGPSVKRRCERPDDDESSQKCSTERQKRTAIATPSHNTPEHSHSSSSSSRTPSSQCIDLTQEEETMCSKIRTAAPDRERKLKTREGPPLSRFENPRARPSGSSRTPCNQLIDLTEEEETLTKHKVSNTEIARKPSHTGITLTPPQPEKHRPFLNLPKTPRGKQDKPLDPGASGSGRGAVTAVNEHLSGLEKLLKGVPTFTPANRPSGQAWSGGWWFKSTSPHET
ncbi:uncharacterized protein [Dendropsophus ebraccatus]|uniref:uncharacterized protein isoform X2 n=1 Tax=Dendropsophus ebraccatus TaxID=150705 RepID=UPI00383130A0